MPNIIRWHVSPEAVAKIKINCFITKTMNVNNTYVMSK